jgi:hypothetical protein
LNDAPCPPFTSHGASISHREEIYFVIITEAVTDILLYVPVDVVFGTYPDTSAPAMKLARPETPPGGLLRRRG